MSSLTKAAAKGDGVSAEHHQPNGGSSSSSGADKNHSAGGGKNQQHGHDSHHHHGVPRSTGWLILLGDGIHNLVVRR